MPSGKASDRKLRLFAVACCRRHWHILTDERSRAAVGVGERLADGYASGLEGEVAKDGANQAIRTAVLTREANSIHEHFIIAARAAGYTVLPSGTFDLEAELATVAACRLMVLHESGGRDNRVFENATLCSTLRCIFGNPFRPVPIDPTLLSTNIIAFAQAVYDERELPSGHLDPARLAVLADALEEAGCTNAEILNHCRNEGPHVRGCWVVDLILGKQ